MVVPMLVTDLWEFMHLILFWEEFFHNSKNSHNKALTQVSNKEILSPDFLNICTKVNNLKVEFTEHLQATETLVDPKDLHPVLPMLPALLEFHLECLKQCLTTQLFSMDSNITKWDSLMVE